jgi:cytoskeletal protein RodZ
MGKQHLTFISYSRTNKDFALELAKELKAAGFLIWFDQLDIPTGSRWDDEIQKALEQCEIFMVILTPNSIASNNVKDEIGYAIDSNKHILPVLLENANIPFRLRRFQYVDFTNIPYNEGIERAKQLLRKLVSEPTGQNPAKPVDTLGQQIGDASEQKIPSPTDAERLARQRAEAIRVARENEQLARQSQQAHPVQTIENKAQNRQKPSTPSKPKLIPIIIGISFLLILCLVGGIYIFNQMITKPTPTTNPVNPPNITIPPSSTATTDISTETASTSTATVEVPTETTPTFTPTPTTTITPFSPQEPDQFITFYFESIIYERNYELAWSLLTETFKEKNNPTGFDEWKSTWDKVVEWKRPDLTTTYITPTKAIVSTPEMWFRSSSWYSLENRQYCVIRDESRNTWMIESKSVCDL